MPHVPERRAPSAYWILGMVAILMVLASSMALTLAYRSTVKNLQDTLSTNCAKGNAERMRTKDGFLSDVNLYEGILAQSTDPKQFTDPALRARAEGFQKALKTAIADKREAADGIEIRDCNQYLADAVIPAR